MRRLVIANGHGRGGHRCCELDVRCRIRFLEDDQQHSLVGGLVDLSDITISLSQVISEKGITESSEVYQRPC